MKKNLIVSFVLYLLLSPGFHSSAAADEEEPKTIPTAGSNAITNLIERHGCNKVKEWGISGAQRAFGAWANNAVVGAEKDVAEGIMNRGVAGAMIENMASVLKGIEVLEEAAFGDPYRAGRIAGEASALYIIAVAGGPFAVAVPVLLELNKIADAVNQEISESNIKTFASFAERDPALRGPNRVEHFLNNYLYWQQEPNNWDFLKEVEPDNAARRLQMASDIIKKRTALFEYVKTHMNVKYFTENFKNFPSVNEWHEGKNHQMVRTAAAALLQEVNYYVQIRRQQKILMEQCKSFRHDAAVIQKFNRWWSTVKGITCGEDLISLGAEVALCVENANSAAELVAEAEGIELIEYDPSMLEQLEENINSVEQDVDAAGPQLQANLLEITEICERGEEEWRVARDSYDEALAISEDLTGIYGRASQHSNLACSTEDYEAAVQEAASAESEVAQANYVARTVQGLDSRFTTLMPPDPVDFEGMLAAVREQKAQAVSLQEEIEEVRSRRQKLDELVYKGTTKLSVCPIKFLEEVHPEISADFREVVADLQGRLSTLKAGIEAAGPIPEMDAVAGLVSQAASNESWLLGLSAQQEQERACLTDLTEMWELALDFQTLENSVQGQLSSIEEQAIQAQQCARELAADEGGDIGDDIRDLTGGGDSGEGGETEGERTIDDILDDPDLARIYEELVEAAEALKESAYDLKQQMRNLESSGDDLCNDGTVGFLFFTTRALDALVRSLYGELLSRAAALTEVSEGEEDADESGLTHLSYGDRRRIAAATLVVNRVKDGYADAVAELERFDPSCDPDELVRRGSQVAERGQDPETGVDGGSAPVSGSGDGGGDGNGNGNGNGGGDGVHFVKSGSPTISGTNRTARCFGEYNGGGVGEATMTITLDATYFPDEIWPGSTVTAGATAYVDLSGPYESADAGFSVFFLNPDNIETVTTSREGTVDARYSFTASEDDFGYPSTIITVGYGGSIGCEFGSDETGAVVITQVYLRVGN